MPESEEERRRRCIIDPSSCQVNGFASQEEALIQELEAAGSRASYYLFRPLAEHLLAHFDLTPKS